MPAAHLILDWQRLTCSLEHSRELAWTLAPPKVRASMPSAATVRSGRSYIY